MAAGSKTRAGAALVGLAAAVLSSGCASRTDATGGHASTVTPVLGASTLPTKVRSESPSAMSSKSPAVAVRAVPPCRMQGSGFELSLVTGFRGAGDPVGAAQWFVRLGGVARFGTASSVWVLADAGQVGRGEATLVDGTVSLDAVRMPNGTWAIESGWRCV